jgi:hypothetical protein
MNKLFISHSSQDDAFVRDLRAALADQGQDGWIDSRELRAFVRRVANTLRDGDRSPGAWNQSCPAFERASVG